MENKEKTSLSEMMETSMSKVREMVSSDTVIGQPITTPDGVTLVPVSRLSFGFSCGGSDFGKVTDGKNFAGGTADRVIEMIPQVMDRVESFIDKKKETTEF